MDLLLAALALAAGANGGARFLRGHGLRAGKGVACEAGEVVGTLGDDGGDCGDRGRQKDGMEVSGLVKLKALVMSPTVARRQAERLGTSVPKRVSRNRSTDV